MGLFEFATSAVILIAAGILWLRRSQPSALLFAALSFYASAGCLKQNELILEFGADEYARAGAIFLMGTVLLVIFMDLARRAFALQGVKSTGLAWNRSIYDRHSRHGLIFALLGLLLLVMDRPDLNLTWNAARLSNSKLSVLANFLLLMAVPACISAFRTGRRTRILALFVTCSAAFVLSGSRAVVMSGFLLGTWMLMQRVHNPLKQMMTVALAIPLAFVLHGVLRFLRGLGPDRIIAALSDGSFFTELTRSMSSSDSSGGELAIVRYFVYSTTVSSDHEFGNLTTLKRLITILVPRIPGIVQKPIDVTYRLWDHAFRSGMFDHVDGAEFLHNSYQEGAMGSLHPNLFGEMFLTGGWWSLFLSIGFIAVIVTAIDRFLLTTDPLLGLTLMGPTLAGYLFVARGNTVVGLGYFVYLFVLLYALGWAGRALNIRTRSLERVHT